MVTFSLLSIILLGFLIWAIVQKKTSVIIEGIVIGVVSGLVISFFTDANFRADIKWPCIELARKLNVPWKYISSNWIDIKAVKTEGGIYRVKAKNIATGTTISFQERSLSGLPADLRYNVMSGDTVIVVPDNYEFSEKEETVMRPKQDNGMENPGA